MSGNGRALPRVPSRFSLLRVAVRVSQSCLPVQTIVSRCWPQDFVCTVSGLPLPSIARVFEVQLTLHRRSPPHLAGPTALILRKLSSHTQRMS